MATSDFGIPTSRSNQISLVGKYARISVAEISYTDATDSVALALSLIMGVWIVLQC